MLNKTGGRWSRFCCDTGCSANLKPAKMAAKGGLKWRPLDPDEPQYKSVTNERSEIIGQTSCYVKLEKVKRTVKLNFLVCMDEGDEALLCLDALKDLSIVSQDFPCPMDDRKRDYRARRVATDDEEEWQEWKNREEEHEKGKDRV